jgi:hypothetical protein
MRHLRHCAVAALCMLHSIFAAEPPKIDALFPAGGQRGTTVECKVTGGAGDGTLQVWTKSGQLSLEFSEKKDSAKVAIPADADPRVHWLRFSNEHGATDLRPFVVGLIEEVLETEPNNQLSESEVINQWCAGEVRRRRYVCFQTDSGPDFGRLGGSEQHPRFTHGRGSAVAG